MKNINTLLTTWGKSQEQTPPNNLALKNQLLAHWDTLPKPYNQKTFTFPWLSMAFASLAIILVIAQASPINQTSNFTQSDNQFGKSPMPNELMQEEIKTKAINEQDSSLSNSAPALNNNFAKEKLDTSETLARRSHSTFAPDFYLPNPASPPITDNRQFLRTAYSALVKTRHTSKLTTQIQMTIKGLDGRVDTINNLPTSGYISFVIPSSRLENFKQALINLVDKKFVLETITAENLLPEKQSIEKQQTQTSNAINSLNLDRENLTKAHNQKTANLQAQINNLTQELKALDSQYPAWSAEYQEQQKTLLKARASLQQQLNAENFNYQNSLNNLNEQIKYNENQLTNLSEQDQTLLDTVATVRGEIAIQSINWLQALHTYFSVYWLALILLCLAGLTFFFRQNKTNMVLP